MAGEAVASNALMPFGLRLFSEGQGDALGTLMDNGLIAALLGGGGVAALQRMMTPVANRVKKRFTPTVFNPLPASGTQAGVPVYTEPLKSSDIFSPKANTGLLDVIASRPTSFGLLLPAMLLAGGLGYGGVNKGVDVIDNVMRKRELDNARDEFRRVLSQTALNRNPRKTASIDEDLDDVDFFIDVVDKAYDEQENSLEKSADDVISNLSIAPKLLWSSLLALSLLSGGAAGYKAFQNTRQDRLESTAERRRHVDFAPKFVATPVEYPDEEDMTYKSSEAKEARDWAEWWAGKSYPEMASEYLKNNPGSITDIWNNLDPQTRSSVMGNIQQSAPEIMQNMNVGDYLKSNPQVVHDILSSMSPETRTSLIQQYMPQVAGSTDMGSVINSYLVGPDGNVDMNKVHSLMNQMSPEIRSQITNGFMGENPMMRTFGDIQKWLQGPNPMGSFMQGAQNAGQGWWQQTSDMLKNLGDLGASFGKHVGNSFGMAPNPPQTSAGTSTIGQMTPPATAAAPTPTSNVSSSPLQLQPGMKSSFA